MGRCARGDCLLQRKQPRANGGQWIADFVRNAGREFAEVGHLLIAFDDGIAFHEPPPERGDNAAVRDERQPDAEGGKQEQRRQHHTLKPREP